MDLNNFLIEREERIKYQKELMLKYNSRFTMCVLKTNYPGENKNSVLSNNIVYFFDKEFINIYMNQIIYREKYINLEGEIYIYILDIENYKLKKETILLEEEHDIGRLVDIDVYETNMIPISRNYFGKKNRKCYICSKNAKVCARNKSHGLNEILFFIENEFRNYLSKYLKKQASKAIMYELLTYPSFGLVSHINEGSHKDMNVYTFLESLFSIEESFYLVSKIGYSSLDLDEAFLRVREIGKMAEIKMFNSTNGVNTHKGLIFIIFIVILAVSRAFYEGKGEESLKYYIKDISKNILNDFDNISKKEVLTNGEKIFLRYGIEGIRGEVHSGLSKVFEKYLPYYREKLNIYDRNKANYLTLVMLMEDIDDTTIINRHNLKKLNEFKIRVKEFGNIENYEELIELEKYCLENNISPGGSADILTIIIFIDLIYGKIKGGKNEKIFRFN